MVAVTDTQASHQDDMAWAKPYVDEARREIARGEVMPGDEFFKRMDAKFGGAEAFRRGAKTIARLAVAAVFLLQPGFSRAQDCPIAESQRQGFVVERGGQSKTEVFYDSPITKTIMRTAGKTLLETTQFEGLFQLDRIDRGHRTTFRPKEELSALFPLKVGQRATVEFLADVGGRMTKATVDLSVVGQDSIYLGPCKYDVLKIDRQESRGERALHFANTDYYAPTLKLIVAKEYKGKNGRQTFIKFDGIYPAKR